MVVEAGTPPPQQPCNVPGTAVASVPERSPFLAALHIERRAEIQERLGAGLTILDRRPHESCPAGLVPSVDIGSELNGQPQGREVAMIGRNVDGTPAPAAIQR